MRANKQNSIRVIANDIAVSVNEFVYFVAGVELVFPYRMRSLASFFDKQRTSQTTESDTLINTEDSLDLCYHGTAPFANKVRKVRFFRSNSLAKIEVDDQDVCFVSLIDSQIHFVNKQNIDSEVNLEILLGPALMLLLAQKDIFCLHAGAVAIKGGNIAFIAESGAGKSTLSSHENDDWCQISDDVLPMIGQKFDARFPQLKLPNACTVKAFNNTNGVDSNLSAIFRINPIPSQSLLFTKMSSTDAMLQIVRHTVASKLFDQTLMIKHANFAKELISAVPVIELSYPRKLSEIAGLRQSLIDYVNCNLMS